MKSLADAESNTYWKQTWKLFHWTKQLCHTDIISFRCIFFAVGLWQNWWICTLIQLAIFWRQNHSIRWQLLSDN